MTVAKTDTAGKHPRPVSHQTVVAHASCPTCYAFTGEQCQVPDGRKARRPHPSRLQAYYAARQTTSKPPRVRNTVSDPILTGVLRM